MRFNVGQKVKKGGKIGTVQEVFSNACFVNYGDFAELEHFVDLEHFMKKKLPTKRQAWKEANKEKQEQEQVIKEVELFCDRLSKI